MGLEETESPSAGRARCWAADVYPCRGPRSQEHFITRGLWQNKHIVVTGLPYSPGPVEKDIDDLCTKSLCGGHNHDLSGLDQAAVDLNNSLRRLEEVRHARQTSRGPAIQSVRLRVQGRLIERWALKTVMNLAVLARFKANGWTLPNWLPHVVFGERSLPEGCGLACFGKVGDQHTAKEEVALAFGHHEKDGMPGLVSFRLRGGLNFLVTWEIPVRTVIMPINGQDYDGSTDALFPIRELNFKHGERDLKVALAFDWSETAREDPAVARLRARYKSPPRS